MIPVAFLLLFFCPNQSLYTSEQTMRSVRQAMRFSTQRPFTQERSIGGQGVHCGGGKGLIVIVPGSGSAIFPCPRAMEERRPATTRSEADIKVVNLMLY
ncbi:hypothetical protein FB451DRAFT_1233759 [Mycena latifolia]|nr:hypothetical protein FB451DRAFT_1233759 [Mycena latifolia]